MKPSSEIHNLRLKELDYVRKDLTHLNESWYDPRYEGRSIAEIRDDIAKRYKESVGQKVQAKMVMFKEGVVVIDENTTMEQLQNLAVAFEEKFGIKTMQIHIHRDEGHQNTEEWKPNLHAHMTFDWTQPNGKSIPSKETPYAKMQTITAEALGMERGVSSDVEHLNAIQYKNKKEGERLIALQQQNELLQEQIENFQQENDSLRVENEELHLKQEELLLMAEQLKKKIKGLKITKNAKQALLERVDGIVGIFGKSDLRKEHEATLAELEEKGKEMEALKGKVDKLRADLERRTTERDKARQELAKAKDVIAAKDETISRQNDRLAALATELNQMKQEKRAQDRAANPRLYAIPDVVDMSQFHFLEAYQSQPSLFIGIEGQGRIWKRIDREDMRACRADEISQEELVAKYFSKEIEIALACRLNRLSGSRLSTEVKKIENTMFFRLPSILRLPCSLNIPAGSTCGENPNVRHRSLEELLGELEDQGIRVNRYSLS
jgi:myosin heavy subunit